MTSTTQIQTARPVNGSRKQATKSADEKWETFPLVPGLRRYVPSGKYYAFVRVRGELKRECLDTDVFTDAKQSLSQKKIDWAKPAAPVGTLANACEQYTTANNSRHELAESSRVYNLRCLDRLKKSLPDFLELPADKIALTDLQTWSLAYRKKFAPQFFNNSLNVLRELFKLAGVDHDKNPAWQIKRVGMPPKELKLPTAEQFAQLVLTVRRAGARQSQDCGDLIELLAFTGCRISEARKLTWADVNFERNELVSFKAKRRETSSAPVRRVIPMVPALRDVLVRIKTARITKDGHEPKPDDTIARVGECEKSLSRACAKVGCARLTHHSLRHLYATFCIEAGIDIPTVARWMGHSDGGALAMKVYGHLRNEHSQLMAQRVTFGLPPVPQPKQLTAVVA